MMMRTRIVIWSLGAALACSMIASADAAPPKVKPVAKPVDDGSFDRTDLPRIVHPEQRKNPELAIQTEYKMSAAGFEEGRLERVVDGALFYSFELTLEMRQAMAAQRGVPVSKIPLRIERRAQIDPRGVTPSMLKTRMGQEVRLELRQDPSGHLYVTNLLTPQRK